LNPGSAELQLGNKDSKDFRDGKNCNVGKESVEFLFSHCCPCCLFFELLLQRFNLSIIAPDFSPGYANKTK
jgi:hypothetical protein